MVIMPPGRYLFPDGCGVITRTDYIPAVFSQNISSTENAGGNKKDRQSRPTISHGPHICDLSSVHGISPSRCLPYQKPHSPPKPPQECLPPPQSHQALGRVAPSRPLPNPPVKKPPAKPPDTHHVISIRVSRFHHPPLPLAQPAQSTRHTAHRPVQQRQGGKGARFPPSRSFLNRCGVGRLVGRPRATRSGSEAPGDINVLAHLDPIPDRCGVTRCLLYQNALVDLSLASIYRLL